MPLTITSYPRPFNQQLPEPPDLRCVLEAQDSLELAPALVCALCCCFGIIYCCFGEGWTQGLGMGGSCLTLLSSRMMLPGHFTSSVRRCLPSEFSTLPPSFLSLCLPIPSGSHLCLHYGLFLCLLPQNSIPSLSFPTRGFNHPQNLDHCVVIPHTPLLEDLDIVLLSLHGASTLPPGFSTYPLRISECLPSSTGFILLFPLPLRFPWCATPGFCSLFSCFFPNTPEPSL